MELPRRFDGSCPCCGQMNRRLDLEETGGYMECIRCGAVVLLVSPGGAAKKAVPR